MKKDMTTGSPMKLILSFTVPLLIGNLFQQFYNMADSYIVSQTVGVEAFSAIGSTTSLQFLIIGLAIGLTAGLSVITAQRFGRKDEEALRKNLAASVVISIVIAIILTLLTTTFTEEILTLMQTPEETYQYAYNYLNVIFWGIGATLLFNLLANLLRALGDSKTPLYFLILTSILNIILDYVLILYFDMGIRGASVATVISQIVSSILCLIFIWKKVPLLRIHKEDWTFNWPEYKEHLRIGLPYGFQYSIIAIGAVAITVTLNKLGANAVAAFTAAQKIDTVAMLPLQSFGVTMSTYAAQNYGARKLNRIWYGVNQAIKLSLSYSIIIGIVLLIWGRQLALLFVGAGASAEVISMIQQFFLTNSTLYAILSLLFIYRHTLQGLGNSLAPTVAGIGELVARAGAATLLSIPFGFLGAALSNPLAWIAALIPLALAYYSTRRSLSGRVSNALEEIEAITPELKPQKVK
ncbi:MATE family efflux transporter [Marinilactibacillus psychrotolerans]|uniref:MATE family efflux transporter n=1 Tax=Marinilactibacillus psychrotolerans TaxID=191770 RepID=A0A5R9C2D8_9LACT|nr:MATE family efflux transporter [Marinilactibacillus psychrotolerans]TLQ06899.1 MATE family efflux transporter [Marinilactibacillus psychrotolerans]